MANMKQQHTQFVITIADSYGLMALDQMRHKLLVEFLIPELARLPSIKMLVSIVH
jgi:hypothetical protein